MNDFNEQLEPTTKNEIAHYMAQVPDNSMDAVFMFCVNGDELDRYDMRACCKPAIILKKQRSEDMLICTVEKVKSRGKIHTHYKSEDDVFYADAFDSEYKSITYSNNTNINILYKISSTGKTYKQNKINKRLANELITQAKSENHILEKLAPVLDGLNILVIDVVHNSKRFTSLFKLKRTNWTYLTHDAYCSNQITNL
jgi:hypothetical protein